MMNSVTILDVAWREPDGSPGRYETFVGATAEDAAVEALYDVFGHGEHVPNAVEVLGTAANAAGASVTFREKVVLSRLTHALEDYRVYDGVDPAWLPEAAQGAFSVVVRPGGYGGIVVEIDMGILISTAGPETKTAMFYFERRQDAVCCTVSPDDEGDAACTVHVTPNRVLVESNFYGGAFQAAQFGPGGASACLPPDTLLYPE